MVCRPEATPWVHLAGVAGEDAEEGGFAFLGLSDGGADEFAELGEEVLAEVGERGVVAAAAAHGAQGVGKLVFGTPAWAVSTLVGFGFLLAASIHFRTFGEAHPVRNTKYGIPPLSLIPPIT